MELNDYYKEVIENQNTENYRIKIHSLKSNLALIGSDLADVALDLENAAREGNADYIDNHHQVFVAVFERTRKMIEQTLDKDIIDKEKSIKDFSEIWMMIRL